ncbi:unnamed protein product [Microthlaspi erraticum]|uniref:Uncharacterized protein n=1 Tax=Microthlaspi erraticum TaxID=1685480 RepID=A0A6D2K5L3_9BRAS|nr:unnamed protein product [Microthlaspi erraticum]
MDTQKIQTENQAEAVVSSTSCNKYVKDESATFFVNLKGRFDNFVNKPMDEHKTCFKNTMDKMFGGMSKAVEEKKVETKEVGSQAA